MTDDRIGLEMLTGLSCTAGLGKAQYLAMGPDTLKFIIVQVE